MSTRARPGVGFCATRWTFGDVTFGDFTWPGSKFFMQIVSRGGFTGGSCHALVSPVASGTY